MLELELSVESVCILYFDRPEQEHVRQKVHTMLLKLGLCEPCGASDHIYR